MRHWIISCSAILLIAASVCRGQSGWAPQNSGTSANLYAVCFIDSYIGFAVGDGGTLIRTADGGATWSAVPLGITANLRDIDFGGKLYGCIVGDSSTIFTTSDGGSTWVPRPVATPAKTNLVDVDFLGDGYGLAAGGKVILSTTNGGEKWASIAPNAYSNWIAVAMPSSDTIFAVDRSSSKETTLHMKPRTSGYWYSYGGNATRFFFLNRRYGWYTGQSQSVSRTSDGGRTWWYSSYNAWPTDAAVMKNIFFADTSYGWGVADSGFIYHSQGQQFDWHFQYSGTTANLHGMYFTSRTNGWVVGDNGTILHTDNGGVTVAADTLLIERFEESVDGWTIQDRWNDSDAWHQTLDAAGAHAGKGSMAMINAKDKNPRWEGLISPSVDIPPGSLATLSFWMKADNSPVVTDPINSKFEVEVSTTGPYDTAFHASPAYYMDFPTKWTHFHVNLGQYGGRRIWVRWLFRQEHPMTSNLDDVLLIAFDRGATSSVVTPVRTMPSALTSFVIYPSPTNGVATVEYLLDARAHVRGSIVDAYGRDAARIVDADEEAGIVRHRLDLTTLPAGIYYYRLQIGERVEARPIVVR